jgi:hypothetical protein
MTQYIMGIYIPAGRPDGGGDSGMDQLVVEAAGPVGSTPQSQRLSGVGRAYLWSVTQAPYQLFSNTYIMYPEFPTSRESKSDVFCREFEKFMPHRWIR